MQRRANVSPNQAFRPTMLWSYLGMKIAISIPDSLFEEAERMARRLKRSRSELYRRALADYLALHSSDQVTDAMDRTLDALESGGRSSPDEFVASAARRVLHRTEW